MDGGWHGILSMAAGTGRAITALAAATRLSVHKKGNFIKLLIVCYYIVEFGIDVSNVICVMPDFDSV
jgi:predicted ribonuclease YlaK